MSKRIDVNIIKIRRNNKENELNKNTLKEILKFDFIYLDLCFVQYEMM